MKKLLRGIKGAFGYGAIELLTFVVVFILIIILIDKYLV